ncbi:MAG: DUF1097 domain-containing protein [Chloroflexi bacterium]|nr:DUF1097 domain-containing protein [Chloroflexota bacterium]
MKKTLALATSIAILAGIWTIVVLKVGSFGSIPFVLWPTFIGWAAFFYLGANGTGMRNGLIQLSTGAILTGLFIWLYAALKVTDPNFIVLGIFVFLVAWPITALSGFNNLWAAVPAGFCGAAAWFGVSGMLPTAAPVTVTIATLIPLFCGEILAWLSLWIVGVLMPEKKAVVGAARA